LQSHATLSVDGVGQHRGILLFFVVDTLWCVEFFLCWRLPRKTLWQRRCACVCERESERERGLLAEVRVHWLYRLRVCVCVCVRERESADGCQAQSFTHAFAPHSCTLYFPKRALYPLARAVYSLKRALYSLQEPYILTKEPCILSKEPCIFPTEPCTLLKKPYTPSKMPYFEEIRLQKRPSPWFNRRTHSFANKSPRNRAFLRECRALLREYRALSGRYRALLREYRALLKETNTWSNQRTNEGLFAKETHATAKFDRFIIHHLVIYLPWY